MEGMRRTPSLTPLSSNLLDRPECMIMGKPGFRMFSRQEQACVGCRWRHFAGARCRRSLHARSGASSLASTARCSTEVSTAMPNKASTQLVRFCTSFDGTRIAFAVTGGGPALVKAPHWLTHLEYEFLSPLWRPWIEALSSRY